MTSSPLVTIGVLSFNNSNYIEETLDSIKTQSYPNIELVIVDDCSTDNSVEIIRRWIDRNHYSCKFIPKNKNEGLPAACNSLLKNASGKYVCWIGSDDIFLPDKIETQVRAFESADSNVGVIYSDSYIIDSKGKKSYTNFIHHFNSTYSGKLPEGDLALALLEGFYLPAVTVMIKREIFDEIGIYDTSLFSEDLDMWLRISRKYKFKYINCCLASYRIHAYAATSTKLGVLSSTFIKIYKKNKGIQYSSVVITAFRKMLKVHAINTYAYNIPEHTKNLLFAFKETLDVKLLVFYLLSVIGVDYKRYIRLKNFLVP